MKRLTKDQALEHASSKIKKVFNTSLPVVFKLQELAQIFEQEKENWLLLKTTRLQDFIDLLSKKEILTSVPIKLKNGNAPRFIKRGATPAEIILSLREHSYLTHYTALFYHGFTINEPKLLFANLEQTPKPRPNQSSLNQTTIDRAFSNSMRKTNDIAEFKLDNTLYQAYLLNGQFQERLGVTDIKVNENFIPITTAERTLIDCTVRPEYAGGVHEVLEAYIRAKDIISVNTLSATLKSMNYIYPYHQSVGFYLEKAGYKNSLIKLIENMPKSFDFYLSYKMKNPKYSEKWKLYYPSEFG